MSAEAAVYTALLTRLRDVPGINGVFAGPPLGTVSPPWAELGPIVAVDWGVKDRAGRELRVQVTLTDRAESAARLLTLAAALADAIETLPRVLDGWELVGVALARTRIATDRPGQWRCIHEYRLRLLAT